MFTCTSIVLGSVFKCKVWFLSRSLCKMSQSSLTVEDCKEVLRRFDPNLRYTAHEISKLSDQTMGFLGEHLKLKIRHSSGTANFFVKVLPTSNENQSNYVKSMGVFHKETSLYEKILTKYLEKSSKKFAAHPYLIKPTVLVLENLLDQSYGVSTTEYFDYPQCVSILETLAVFHAATINFEETRSDATKKFTMIEHYPEELQECTFVLIEGHPRQRWIESTLKSVINCIKLLPQYGGGVDEGKLYKIVKRSIEKFTQPSVKYRNVVTHDDLWKNNLMFRKTNGQYESLLVDFQLVRYSPPAFDVLTALYLNSERNFLEKHFGDFVNIYYKALCDELNMYNLKPEVVFPKNNFLESIEEYKLPALIEAAFFGTNVYIRDELAQKIVSNEEIFNEFAFINRSKYVCKEFVEDVNFRTRICNVLHPFMERVMEAVV